MLTASVGSGGQNRAGDVRQVQAALNAANGAALSVDGACGPATIAAIMAFQSRIGMAQPDGLIAASGPTDMALFHQPAEPSGRVPKLGGPLCTILDLSHNNAGPIDFASLARGGVSAVLLKSSEGETGHDPIFANRLTAAREAGLLTGAYHFGTARPAAAQLANYMASLRAAGVSATEIVTALDVEPNPGDAPNTMSVSLAAEWVSAFRQQTGATPLIYGARNWLGTSSGNAAALTACPLWIAEYSSDESCVPSPLPGWQDWSLWQYTDGSQGAFAGSFAGIISDRSVFRGNAPELAAFWQSCLAARDATV